MRDLGKQWELPAGFDAEGQMIPLDQVVGGRVAPLAELDRDQRAALVRARWEAGEWTDVLIGGEHIDLARGIRELEARSTIGELLLESGENSIELVLEDARRLEPG